MKAMPIIHKPYHDGTMKINRKRFLIAFILIAASLSTYAQKLPGKQEVSVRAPVDIKIDGKATEWGDKFQAYNKATDIYYTLSNDDENIYLVVQAKYHDVADKILRGGITLTINHTFAKKDNAPVAITYPIFSGSGQSDVTNMLSRKENEKREANNSGVPAIDDMNKILDARAKTIRILGINPITDKEISVYNQEGIKAVSQFDKTLVYTYELAIPLKYLALPGGGFSYNIKINGPEDVAAPHTTAGGPPPPPMMTTSTVPTDFWGEYTLAKK
jgi:hypothetical protein